MGRKMINTENELYSALGVKGAHEISGAKLDSMCSMIRQINPDVLEKVVAIVPNYAEATAKIAREAVSVFEEDYKGINDNDTIKALNDMLEFLKNEAQKDNLSLEEKMKLKDEMLKIIDRVAEERRIKEEELRLLRKHKIIFIISIVLIVLLTGGLVALFFVIPGFLAETITIVLGVLGLAAILAFYNLKKREIKARYKKMK